MRLRAACRAARSWSIVLLSAAAWVQVARAQALAYPAPHRDGVVDTLFGTPIADPFRWLEQLDGPATVEWVALQRRLTDDYLARLPGRERIRGRLAALWNYSRTDVPWREAGRLFFTENNGAQPQPLLYTVKGPGDSARVVLDPQDISPDGSIAVGDYSVSPDGRWLAYSEAPGGSGGDTHVRDLATGREQGDVVRDTRGSVCWTFDGTGFFYWRPRPAQPGEDVTAARLEKQYLYHSLGSPQQQDRMIHEWKGARSLGSPRSAAREPRGAVHPDGDGGRHAVRLHRSRRAAGARDRARPQRRRGSAAAWGSARISRRDSVGDRRRR